MSFNPLTNVVLKSVKFRQLSFFDTVLEKPLTQINSSTIEFVHFIMTSQVSIKFLCPTKLLKIVIILESK